MFIIAMSIIIIIILVIGLNWGALVVMEKMREKSSQKRLQELRGAYITQIYELLDRVYTLECGCIGVCRMLSEYCGDLNLKGTSCLIYEIKMKKIEISSWVSIQQYETVEMMLREIIRKKGAF